MGKGILKMLGAALVAGAACFSPDPAFAGSCCGGGAGVSLMVPKYARSVIDASFDMEVYGGFWNQNGEHTPDPSGSDLKQYRFNLGYGRRFFQRWQASLVIPYVWNQNRYSGLSSRSDGLGDATLNLWYELLEDTSAWRIRTLSDLVPSVTIGPALLIPTGTSPYDKVDSSFDVTGRGFYRIEGNILVEKTLQPWIVSALFSYGWYFERPVNREYGKYVEPYQKKLGGRTFGSLSLSYNYFLGSGGHTLTGTASFSFLQEAEERVNGNVDPSSGFRKTAVGACLAYSSFDHDWSLRLSWSHAIQVDGWGKNFPTTDIFTVGVRYAFR